MREIKRRWLLGAQLVTLTAVLLLSIGTASAAVSKVICVPWQGDVAKFHTALNTGDTQLKGIIKTTDTTAVFYRWDFGDGNVSTVNQLNGGTKYNVVTTHPYTLGSLTPITAQLQVSNGNSPFATVMESPYLLKIQDNTLDAQINIAIDKGLWYLYANATTAGSTLDSSAFLSWQDSNYSVYASPTASAIQAFAINNHKIKGNPDLDPYVEAVQLGMNFLMKGNQALMGVNLPSSTGIQTWNGFDHQVYEGGQIMDAIIASGVLPDESIGRSFNGTTNWTYRQVLQGLADMYVHYQHVPNGGYDEWNFGSGQWDNSSSQWASIGMIPAQAAPWNIVIPATTKTYSNNWLNASFCNVGGGMGYFGYQGGCGNYNDGAYNTTPCGMVQLNFAGMPSSDARWAAGAKYMANYWWNVLQDGSVWGNYKTYGFYSFAKAMRLAQPAAVEQITKPNGHAFDWYRGGANLTNVADFDKGLAVRILEIQNTGDGHWVGNLTGANLTTAWMIITLRPTLFAAAPIACFTASPNPTFALQDVTFDPSCSGHSETGKDIKNLTLFEWSWGDGTADSSTTTPDVLKHKFACPAVPCTFSVRLRVTDDLQPTGLTATAVVDVKITDPPHPPVANAGGPYVASTCGNDSLKLDGSKSFDQDAGLHQTNCSTCPNDAITAWDWDLKAPLSFDLINKTGPTPSLTAADIASLFGIGSNGVALRVTDNTALAYPASGSVNLVSNPASFSSADIATGCLCGLIARAKNKTVQLDWAAAEHTPATLYTIYRSTAGPNTGFTKILTGYSNLYSTFVDTGLINGTTYYYRVEKMSAAAGVCRSPSVNGTPKALF